MPEKKFPYGFILILLVTLIAGLVLGYAIGQKKAPEIQKLKPTLGDINSFFTSQSATVTGEVVSLDSNMLKLKNSNAYEESFELADNVLITKYASNNRPSSPSANLKDLEFGKNAITNLRFIDNKFKVISVLYLAPLPSPAPSANSSKKP